MAYETKYRIFFSDVDGEEYRADLKFEGWAGSIKEFTGSGNTCKIQYGDSSNKFDPVNGSGCTLNFYNDGTLDAEDLFAISNYDISLIVQRLANSTFVTIWGGYVNPEVFNEDYSWDEGVLSLTANDGLSAMKRDKYFTGTDVDADGLVIKPWRLGTENVRTVIAKCLSEGVFSRIYTVIDTEGAVSSFEDLEVDLSNYVDEDGESFTKREVLESILEPLTLRCYIFGYACWIVDPAVLALDSIFVFYKAYDGSFEPKPAEDSVYEGDFDISNNEVWFRDGNQSASLVGGFKTFISNYSAYPDVKKIIPFNPSEIPIDPVAAWEHVPYNGSGEGGYSYKDITAYDYSNYGVSFSVDGGLTEYASADSDEAYTALRANLDAGTDTGELVFIGENAIFLESDPSLTDPDEIMINVEGGWIPKSSDKIKVRFKFLVNSEQWGGAQANLMELATSIKIGNSYSLGISSGNTFSTWDATGSVGYTLVDPRNQTESGDGRRSWLQVEFNIDSPPEGGLIEIRFGREIKLYNTNGGLFYAYFGTDPRCFFKEFEVFINSNDINDKDLEYKTESEIDFINSHTVEINNSSRRVNGSLDRGAFINTNGEHETYFSRISFPQSGSIGLTMAKAILANYELPYRKLSGTLAYGGDFLRNTEGIISEYFIPKQISNVFTPIKIIKDTDYLGTKRFMFSGGTIDLINKEITGSWDQIFDANYTITET